MDTPPDFLQLRLFGTPEPLWAADHHPRSFAPSTDQVEGGAFDYSALPEVFLGRTGEGPLRVAWDTNVLIDYATIGPHVWEDDRADQPQDDQLAPDQAALVSLMEIWMVRDIRIHVFERQLDDCKRNLTDSRRDLRVRQIEQIRSALWCLGHAADVEPDAARSRVERALQRTPAGFDTELLALAVNAGCHVFLTCDKGILRARDEVRRFGMIVATPSELLGAFGSDGSGWWFAAGGWMLAPDNHKWVHLMAACG